jgi:WD40 repeat protein
MHSAPVERVAVSPDGQTLLTQDSRSVVGIWELVPGKSFTLRRTFPIRNATALAFSPDGKLFATGGERGMQVWETATHRPAGPPLVGAGFVQSAAVSPDGQTVVTGGQGGVALWQVETGKRQLDLPHPSSATGVAFSPDGRSVLTGGLDGVARLWDAATGQQVGSPFRLANPVEGVAFGPDDKTFVTTGGAEGAPLVWETGQAGRTDRVVRYPYMIGIIRFSPDGQTVLTGGAQPDVPLPGVARLRSWKAFAEYVGDRLKNEHLYHGEACCRDAATGVRLGPLLVYRGAVLAGAFSPDGTKWLVGSCNLSGGGGGATLGAVTTGPPLAQPYRRKDEGIPAVAFSPDGRTYLTGAETGNARLCDAATGQLIREFIHINKAIRGVAYSPDGRTILTGSDDRTAQLWEAATGRPLGKPMQHPACVASVAFSPDGKSVLTGCHDNLARIWDVATGEPTGKTFSHRDWVLAAAFSPDGSLVLTGSKDGRARLWDRATGLPIGPPVQHDKEPITGLNWVPTVTFNPNGRTLVTGGADRTARFRRVPQPVEGKPERVGLWVEVITGLTLDADGIVHPLDAAGWQQRRQRLKELGGPPRQTEGAR